MLSTPDHLLVLRVFDYLSRDQGETDQPVVPQNFLLVLLEDGSDIYSLPPFRNLSYSPQMSKDN